MPEPSPDIEAEYQARIDALLPWERVAMAEAMYDWTREMIGRQIVQERAAQGAEISYEELKWQVALRHYGDEPEVAAMIRERLEQISR